jgi:hypothetical protein
LWQDKTKWSRPEKPEAAEALRNLCTLSIDRLIVLNKGLKSDAGSAERCSDATQVLCALRCLMREDNCDGKAEIVGECLSLIRSYITNLAVQIQGAAVVNNLSFGGVRVFLHSTLTSAA